jgi:hypothetical protein
MIFHYQKHTVLNYSFVFQERNYLITLVTRSALMTALAVLLPVVFVLVLVALVLSWRTKVFHIQVSKLTKILVLQLYYIFK